MGLNAIVKCNCFKNGLLNTVPPHQEYVREDIDGIFLDLEYESHQNEHQLFNSWLNNSPCIHEEMELCNEQIVLSPAFEKIFFSQQDSQFKFLKEYVIQRNKDHIPVEVLPLLLKEIILIEKLEYESRIVLTETTSRIILTSNRFIENKKIRWIENEEFCYSTLDDKFIVESKKESEKYLLFESKCFVQIPLNSPFVILRDQSTRKECTVNLNLLSQIKWGGPDNLKTTKFKLEQVNIKVSEEFENILIAMKTLIKNALIIKRPIVWC